MNKHNLKVGQTVLVIGNQRHTKSELRESEIIKVGSKYFTLDNREQFELETLTHKTIYMPSYKIYLDIKDYDEMIERNQIESQVRAVFGNYGKVKLTLDTLRKIQLLLNEPVTTTRN